MRSTRSWTDLASALADGALIDSCSGACAGTGIEPQAKRRKIRQEMDNLAAPHYWIPP